MQLNVKQCLMERFFVDRHVYKDSMKTKTKKKLHFSVSSYFLVQRNDLYKTICWNNHLLILFVVFSLIRIPNIQFTILPTTTKKILMKTTSKREKRKKCKQIEKSKKNAQQKEQWFSSCCVETRQSNKPSNEIIALSTRGKYP